jgi:uncharacterized protein (TIGR02444 family)
LSRPDPRTDARPLDPDAFWEFSLAYYSRETVAAACLSLQNRRGADVNILLLCCWLATLDLHLDESGLQAAIAAAEAWRRDVLEPLRGARRAAAERFPELAKADRQSIKHGLLSVELECEHIAQERICAAIAPLAATVEAPNARDIAGSSIEVYLGLIITEPDDSDAKDFEALIAPL